MGEARLCGFVFAMEDEMYALCSVDLSKSDSQKIMEILKGYETDGVSISGKAEEISLSDII